MSKGTGDVLGHHLQSFGEGNLQELLSDYTEDSFIVAPDGTVLRGLAKIQAMFEGMLADFAEDATFEMGATAIEGDLAYITWKASTKTSDYHLGTDTFIIRDGKIVQQTVAIHATPKG